MQDILIDWKAWAAWQLGPVAHSNLGYGGTVCGRIMDGQGELLPGPPRGSGPRKIEASPGSLRVELWLRENRIWLPYARSYWLRPFESRQEQSERHKISLRSYYRRVERMHRLYFDQNA